MWEPQPEQTVNTVQRVYSVHTNDMDSLAPRKHLCGWVIDYYLAVWSATNMERTKQERYLIFPAHYVMILRGEGCHFKKDVHRKLTKKHDVLRRDFLLFPVNELLNGVGHHWYLVIFCLFPKMMFEGDDHTQRRCVLVLDSSPSDTSKPHAIETVGLLKTWLSQFLQERRREAWAEDLPLVPVPVREQSTNNCGVNVIYNAEKFLRGGGNRGHLGLANYQDVDDLCTQYSWDPPDNPRKRIKSYIKGTCVCLCVCVSVCLCVGLFACVRASRYHRTAN